MSSQGNHLAYNSVFNLLELVISSSETRWAWQNSNSQTFNFNLINSALRNFYWAKSEFSQQMKGMVLSLFVIQCLLLDQRCVELSIKNVQFTFTKWKINVYTGNFIECKFKTKSCESGHKSVIDVYFVEPPCQDVLCILIVYRVFQFKPTISQRIGTREIGVCDHSMLTFNQYKNPFLSFSW